MRSIYRCALALVLSLAATAHAQETRPADALGDPLPTGAIARYGTTRLQNPRGAWAVAISPDKSTLATADGTYRILLWDAKTGRRLWATKPLEQITSVLAFGDAGRTLAAADAKAHTVVLYDVAGEQPAVTLPNAMDSGPQEILFTPDGKQLIAVGTVVRIWDRTTGKVAAEIDGIPRMMTAAALSADGQLLAAGGMNKDVCVWDLPTRKEKWKLKLPGMPASSVAFSPDGRYLAAGLRGWPVSEYNDQRTAIIKSTWHDAVTVVWDAKTGAEIKQIDGVSSPRFLPDGKTMAAAKIVERGPDWELAYVDLATWTVKATDISCGHKWALADDGTLLAACASTGGLRLLTLPEGKPAVALPGPQATIGLVALAGDCVVTGHGAASMPWPAAGDAHVWDASTGRIVKELSDGQVTLLAGAVSLDGKTFAGACADHTLRLWDAKSWDQTKSLPLPPPGMPPATQSGKVMPRYAVALAWTSADEVLVLTANQRLTRLHVDTGATEALGGDAAHTTWLVRGQAVSPDGKTVALLNFDHGTIFDTHTGATITDLDMPKIGAVTGTRFSADSKTLAAAFPNGTVQLWHAATGKRLRQIPGPEGHLPYGLALSPDGQLLATAGMRDKTVRLFRVEDGKELTRFPGHEADIMCVDFTADGKSIISGSMDGTALRWDISGWVGQH